MKWLLLTIFLSGCTIVLWSDNSTIYQDTGIGDDAIDLPKRLKR